VDTGSRQEIRAKKKWAVGKFWREPGAYGTIRPTSMEFGSAILPGRTAIILLFWLTIGRQYALNRTPDGLEMDFWPIAVGREKRCNGGAAQIQFRACQV
jgi:hypothetical protein